MSDQLLRLLYAQQLAQQQSTSQAAQPPQNANPLQNLAALFQNGLMAQPNMLQAFMLAQQQAQAANLLSMMQRGDLNNGFQNPFEMLNRLLARKLANDSTSNGNSSASPSTNDTDGSSNDLEPGEVPKKATKTPPKPKSKPDPKPPPNPMLDYIIKNSGAILGSLGKRPAPVAQNGAPEVDWSKLLGLQTARTPAPSKRKAKKPQKIVMEEPEMSMGRLTPIDEDTKARRSGVPDIELLKKTLTIGWRRQTFVRSITASGVRGDVVYYAPCGKKFGTYAEVVRHLNRLDKAHGLTREHFSFSCKMMVGEFVMFELQEDTGEKKIMKMTAEEVQEEIARLNRPKPPKIIPEKIPKKPKKIKEEEKEEEFDHGEEFVEEAIKDLDDAKGSRIPVDDLQLDEIRALPDLARVEGLELKGNGFADALMVYEFLQNFRHVLKIEPQQVPSLDVLTAGLAGDEKYRTTIFTLTKTLLTLALEFPGFPKHDPNELRKQAGELELSRDNFSEIMRMWLQTRKKQGIKLSEYLADAHFESISGEKKAEILGFICNELLFCRNIIREIDSNLEEISKLRGERWMREGKVRALRGVQTKKAKKKEKVKQEGDAPEGERPESPMSDHSRSPSPAAKKTFTPGIGQCEVLTEEEQNKTVEELEDQIVGLNAEADEIRGKVNVICNRVRTFPLGQDRFHRIYWQLPTVDGVLVEGVESAAKNNASVNLNETCQFDPVGVTDPESFIHPDVISCLEDTIDAVIAGKPDKKKPKRRRRLENHAKRGWWTVAENHLKPLRDSLHGRGIRERALHRLLLRDSFLKEQHWAHLDLTPVSTPSDPKTLSEEQIFRAERALRELENRIFDAHLQTKGWKPPFEPFDQPDEETSQSNWVDEVPDVAHLDPMPNMEQLRKRLLEVEENTEPRYLRQDFYAGETISIKRVMGKDQNKKAKIVEADPQLDVSDENLQIVEAEEKEEKDDEKEEKEEEHEDDEEEEGELCEIWKQAVQEATTPASIVILAQVLEQNIAWERSVMKAACQICHTSDHDDKLLLCDLCELGYHLYCFKPAMDKVPEGEWFCPKCKETASRKPTCLLCSDHKTPIYNCQKCHAFFHTECAGEPTPENPSTYKCAACEGRKKSVRILERELEPRAPSETGSEDTPGGRKPPKRKPGSDLIIFPAPMVAELAKTMLDELEAQEHSLPFLEPVDLKAVPDYLDVIDQPIDMLTMRQKADDGEYPTAEDFHADVELMFANCRKFNEDKSPIGAAGLALNRFFSKRWRQVRYNFCKRLKRLKPSY